VFTDKSRRFAYGLLSPGRQSVSDTPTEQGRR
jgi:hypothetical protein